MVPGLTLVTLLASMYWRDLDAAARRLAVLGAAAVIAESWLLHPIGRNPEHMIWAAAWALPLLASGLSLAREMATGALRYQHELAAQTARQESAAFHRGRASVVDMVSLAAKEAHQRLDHVDHGLPAPDAHWAKQKLEQIDLRLSELLHPEPSTPSTTTT